MRGIALLLLLCFGCATTRPPTVTPLDVAGDPPLRVSLGEPTLELWMEGTRPASPAETAETLAASRSALAEALEGRAGPLASGAEPDAFLVVKERAVARTGERRAAQVWSVVGVVVAVAFVVVAILVLRDGGSRPKRPTAVASPSRVVPGPGPWRGPRAYAPGPSPFFFGWAVGVTVPLHASPPAPPAPPDGVAGPPASVAAADSAPDPLLDERGWFDGDEVELQAELVDARTGEARWRRALRQGADPRDARAVSALLDRLVEGQPFGQRRAPREIGVRRDPSPEGGGRPAEAPPSALPDAEL